MLDPHYYSLVTSLIALVVFGPIWLNSWWRDIQLEQATFQMTFERGLLAFKDYRRERYSAYYSKDYRNNNS